MAMTLARFTVVLQVRNRRVETTQQVVAGGGAEVAEHRLAAALEGVLTRSGSQSAVPGVSPLATEE